MCEEADACLHKFIIMLLRFVCGKSFSPHQLQRHLTENFLNFFQPLVFKIINFAQEKMVKNSLAVAE
jgi:hypothetical protein